MTITYTKKNLLIVTSVVAVAVLVVFVLSSNWLSSGVESRLLDSGRLNVQGQQAVIQATKASETSQLKLFLEKNAGLAVYLNNELQRIEPQNDWGQERAQYFSRVSSSLRQLLESSERSWAKQSLNDSKDNERLLATYLDVFIGSQRDLGNGYVSNLSETDQQAVGDAIKLLASLNDDRDFKQELTNVAAWYATEKSAKISSSSYREWLLHYAWELSSIDIGLDSSDFAEELPASLKMDTDLTRLLNHQDDVVVKNAAHLISVFAPQNAITALRFQLLRSTDNQEQFLLLDAIKSYGENRSEVELQLKKMLRLTRDTKLQEKIMETIDHLNGRSNTLLTKSN